MKSDYEYLQFDLHNENEKKKRKDKWLGLHLCIIWKWKRWVLSWKGPAIFFLFFAQSAETSDYRPYFMLRIASGGSKAKQQALFSSDSNASVPLAQKASVSHSSLGATQSMEQS